MTRVPAVAGIGGDQRLRRVRPPRRERDRRAPRAYVLAHGVDIPAVLVIDHLCRVRRCVNPEHLRVQQPREPPRAGIRALARTQREQTHCRRGHELADENLDPYQLARGRRQCQACKTAYNRLSSRRGKDGTGWAKPSSPSGRRPNVQ